MRSGTQSPSSCVGSPGPSSASSAETNTFAISPGVPHLLGLLTTVFLAELDAPVPGKHWNTTFTDEQRSAVEALPPVGASRDLLVGFGLAVAELVLTRARPLFATRDLAWPSALATVAAERLRHGLGLETDDWLY